MTDTCKTCRFWVPNADATRGGNGDIGGGHCRRYPPAFPSAWDVWVANKPGRTHEVRVSGGFLNDAWPNVHQQSWCGEHKPKVDTPKERNND